MAKYWLEIPILNTFNVLRHTPSQCRTQLWIIVSRHYPIGFTLKNYRIKGRSHGVNPACSGTRERTCK